MKTRMALWVLVLLTAGCQGLGPAQAPADAPGYRVLGGDNCDPSPSPSTTPVDPGVEG